MAASETIAQKLLSLLITNKTAVLSINTVTDTTIFRVDGMKFSTAIVEVSATGVEIMMNEIGRSRGRRVSVLKGLTYADIALMIESAAEGALGCDSAISAITK